MLIDSIMSPRSSKKLSNTEQKKKNNEMPILGNLNHVPEIKKYLKSYEKILVGYDKRIKALPRELRSTKREIKKISQNLEKTSVFTNSGDPFVAPIKKGIKKYNRLQGELSQLYKNKKQKKEDLQTFKRRYNAINKYSNRLQKQIALYENHINYIVSPNQRKKLKYELNTMKRIYNGEKHAFKNKINNSTLFNTPKKPRAPGNKNNNQ